MVHRTKNIDVATLFNLLQIRVKAQLCSAGHRVSGVWENLPG